MANEIPISVVDRKIKVGRHVPATMTNIGRDYLSVSLDKEWDDPSYKLRVTLYSEAPYVSVQDWWDGESAIEIPQEITSCPAFKVTVAQVSKNGDERLVTQAMDEPIENPRNGHDEGAEPGDRTRDIIVRAEEAVANAVKAFDDGMIAWNSEFDKSQDSRDEMFQASVNDMWEMFDDDQDYRNSKFHDKMENVWGRDVKATMADVDLKLSKKMAEVDKTLAETIDEKSGEFEILYDDLSDKFVDAMSEWGESIGSATDEANMAAHNVATTLPQVRALAADLEQKRNTDYWRGNPGKDADIAGAEAAKDAANMAAEAAIDAAVSANTATSEAYDAANELREAAERGDFDGHTPTDAELTPLINELIDVKLGVIENGTY